MVKVCVFCGSPIAKRGEGEHVYPRWWLRMWQENGGGPFYAQVGGDDVCRREKDGGGRREMPELSPVKLYEVCGSWSGSPNCNGKLAQLFETEGGPLVEAVWRSATVLTQRAVSAFAAWWVKTLLLASHPLTTDTFPGVGQARKSQPYPTEPGSNRPLLPRLHGSELFPPDLSLWLAVGDETGGRHALDEHSPIMLPTIQYGTRPAGSGTPMGTGPSLLSSRQRVLLTLLHHPHATVDHPFEQAGLAVRLWPDPPALLDISALPVLNNTGIQQFETQFVVADSTEIVRDESEGPFLLHACSSARSGLPWPYCGCAG
ncbi:hypothetical protein AB0I39_08130 [Kitasatospora purpeofusca]|uniref:hypothetical protein n=1 Tax=Kitasatospora purpeofusca TaxID=67352 RepID=UPI0033F5DA97